MLRSVGGGAGGAGTPGSQIRNGSGVPSNSLGIDGDYYIDTDTGFLYVRAAGVYAVSVNMSGAGGGGTDNASSPVIVGVGAPDSTIGTAGNAYVDSSTNLVYMPKGVASITPQGFFGVNIHIGYTSSYWPSMTAASYLALFAQMGIQTVRTNIASVAKANAVIGTIKGLIAGGIDVLIVIDASPNLGSTFSAQQSAASTLGAGIANVLKGSGIVNIETSNEFDFNCKINGPNPRTFVADGASYDDFTPSKFECWRGWTSGMLSGFRGVTGEFKLGYASGVAFPQTAFRMLREGRDTTGAVTQTPLQIDFLGAHFYDTESTNPLSYTAKSRTGSAQAVNSLAEVRGLTGNATYDVPQTPAFDLYVTEWGSKAPDSNQGSFVGSAASVYFANRTTYNIKGIYVYVLFADVTDSGTGPVFGVAANNFGIIQADGSTKKAAYTSYTNFINANTVTTQGGWPAVPRYLPAPNYGNGAQVLNTLTTTNNTLRSITIPGKSMGPNTMLRITAVFSCPNNANTKTFRITFGGITWHQSGYTTAATVRIEIIIQNRNALNSQMGAVVSMIGPAFNAGPVLTGAIDTTADQVVGFQAQAGTGTDQLALESCNIQLVG